MMRNISVIILSYFVAIAPSVHISSAFTSTSLSTSTSTSTTTNSDKNSFQLYSQRRSVEVDEPENLDTSSVTSRRGFVLTGGSAIAGSSLLFSSSVAHAAQENSDEAAGGVRLFTTKSGLKYIDLKEGDGIQPKYGNFCTIAFKASIKLPTNSKNPEKSKSEPQEYYRDNAFLTKHGNGRIIPGLDEGLHTMKVGGTRRLIIPAKLGYIRSGLGPIPDSPIARYKLSSLLDQMIELKGGNLVFDVTLKSVIPDEADQGYYEDFSLDMDDYNRLRENIQKAGREARDVEKESASGPIS